MKSRYLKDYKNNLFNIPKNFDNGSAKELQR